MVLVLMVMRGRGRRTRAGARGMRERRIGGEGECRQKGRDTLRLSGSEEGVQELYQGRGRRRNKKADAGGDNGGGRGICGSRDCPGGGSCGGRGRGRDRDPAKKGEHRERGGRWRVAGVRVRVGADGGGGGGRHRSRRGGGCDQSVHGARMVSVSPGCGGEPQAEAQKVT